MGVRGSLHCLRPCPIILPAWSLCGAELSKRAPAGMICCSILIASLLGGAEGGAAPYGRQVLEEAERHFQQGTLALQGKQYTSAARAFRRVQELLPDMPGAYWGLGMVSFEQGDCEQAVALLEQYVRLLEALHRQGALRAPRPPRHDALLALERCRAPAPPQPELASLQISSTPAGAAVLLDEREVGTTPLVLAQVAPGRHRLDLTLPGHAPEERELTLSPGEQAVAHVPLARFARLDLLSRPLGAEVTLDGKPVGVTPVSLAELTAGAHTWSCALSGQKGGWTGSVVLAPEHPVTLTVPLAADGALLAVTSAPPGAEVTLDGAVLGHTPLGPGPVAAGAHELSVMLPGYGLEQRRIEVSRGQPAALSFELRPIRLDLRAVGVPPGAAFYVDGEPVEVEGGWVRGLPVGEHELMVVKQGYLPWFARMSFVAGESDEIEVHLLRQAGGRNEYWWSAGSAAVAAASLAGAGYFGVDGLRHGGSASFVLAGSLAALGVAAAVVALQSWPAGEKPGSGLPGEPLPGLQSKRDAPPPPPAWASLRAPGPGRAAAPLVWGMSFDVDLGFLPGW